jgi:uncharacterized protein (DUF4415 family)
MLAPYRATGPGWYSRINQALRTVGFRRYGDT